MPSSSGSSSKARSEHLNDIEAAPPAASPSTAKILPPTLPTELSPHCRTTVAAGSVRMKASNGARSNRSAPRDPDMAARRSFQAEAEAVAGALAQLIGQETPVPCSPQ